MLGHVLQLHYIGHFDYSLLHHDDDDQAARISGFDGVEVLGKPGPIKPTCTQSGYYILHDPGTF